MKSINPANCETIGNYPPHSEADIDGALTAARKAQKAWGAKPLDERVLLLGRLAQVLRARKPELAKLITMEMGKPIMEAEAEIEKCAFNCEYYKDHASQFLSDEKVSSSASESFVSYDPLGVVLAVMPWNYPFWQFFRFVAPAFAAGNGAILKHASNVPQCALAIADVMREAESPEGLCTVLLIGSQQVAGIIGDDRIAAVTMTGSTAAGSQIAATAGAALKKQVLELGGSDPYIVLEDADIPAAAKMAVKARFTNTGQSCINAKRFIVVDSVADVFVEQFVHNVKALVVGDPMNRSTEIGPMARPSLRDELHDQVERTVAAGATLKTGGEFVGDTGCWYAPTVLDNVKPDQAAFCEETFGPVAAVIRVRNAQEAIALANSSEFGLGAALWTKDMARALTLTRQIEAGAVFINAMTASDPRLPFGGIKRSGYGRELGAHGIREFTNIKTVWIGPAQDK